MSTNPKGYRPKKSRVLFPLTVKEQRKLLAVDEDTNMRVRALILLSLSTGMHPKVLSMPDAYGLVWTKEYFSWNRTKSRRQVQGAWSKAMREKDTLILLKKWLKMHLTML